MCCRFAVWSDPQVSGKWKNSNLYLGFSAIIVNLWAADEHWAFSCSSCVFICRIRFLHFLLPHGTTRTDPGCLSWLLWKVAFFLLSIRTCTRNRESGTATESFSLWKSIIFYCIPDDNNDMVKGYVLECMHSGKGDDAIQRIGLEVSENRITRYMGILHAKRCHWETASRHGLGFYHSFLMIWFGNLFRGHSIMRFPSWVQLNPKLSKYFIGMEYGTWMIKTCKNE